MEVDAGFAHVGILSPRRLKPVSFWPSTFGNPAAVKNLPARVTLEADRARPYFPRSQAWITSPANSSVAIGSADISSGAREHAATEAVVWRATAALVLRRSG